MIIILHVNAGSGSLTLAKNIQQILNNYQIENQVLSLHDLLPKWLDDFLFGSYQKWCLENKNNFSAIFRSEWFYPLLYRLLPLFIRLRGRGCRIPAQLSSADAVISCSFFCGWFAHYWKIRSNKKYSLFGVLGDYTVSPGWKLKIDRLFTSYAFHNSVFDYIRKAGGKITVSGIPTTLTPVSRHEKSGTVLFCGGGWGLQISTETVAALLEQELTEKVVVLCGENTILRRNLCHKYKNNIMRGELEVHGFIHDMQPIYQESDVVITKAGGLTLTEAAALGIPIIISGYLPGHEEENMNVFLENDAAIYAKDREALITAVTMIFQDQCRAELLKSNALKLTGQNSAEIITSKIIEDMKNVDA